MTIYNKTYHVPGTLYILIPLTPYNYLQSRYYCHYITIKETTAEISSKRTNDFSRPHS